MLFKRFIALTLALCVFMFTEVTPALAFTLSGTTTGSVSTTATRRLDTPPPSVTASGVQVEQIQAGGPLQPPAPPTNVLTQPYVGSPLQPSAMGAPLGSTGYGAPLTAAGYGTPLQNVGYGSPLRAAHESRPLKAPRKSKGLKGPGKIDAIKGPGAADPIDGPGPVDPIDPPVLGSIIQPPALGTIIHGPGTIDPIDGPGAVDPMHGPGAIDPIDPPVMGTTIQSPVLGSVMQPPVLGNVVHPPVMGTVIQPPVVGDVMDPPVMGTMIQPPVAGQPLTGPRLGDPLVGPGTTESLDCSQVLCTQHNEIMTLPNNSLTPRTQSGPLPEFTVVFTQVSVDNLLTPIEAVQIAYNAGLPIGVSPWELDLRANATYAEWTVRSILYQTNNERGGYLVKIDASTGSIQGVYGWRSYNTASSQGGITSPAAGTTIQPPSSGTSITGPADGTPLTFVPGEPMVASIYPGELIGPEIDEAAVLRGPELGPTLEPFDLKDPGHRVTESDSWWNLGILGLLYGLAYGIGA